MAKQTFSKGEPCPRCGQTKEYLVQLEGHDAEVRCAYCDELKGVLISQVQKPKDTL